VYGYVWSSSHDKGFADSRNLMCEIVGKEKPQEIVLLAAHMDSWDVGQGAHDDGQGVIVIWEVIRLLHKLGLRPRRTIRAVLYTDEEMRSTGAAAYAEAHQNEVQQHVAAIETDLGVAKPKGFGFSGCSEALIDAAQLATLLHTFEATTVLGGDSNFPDWHGLGVDIAPMVKQGVPGFLLRFDDKWMVSDYFLLHHTEADTIDKVDRNMLTVNVQVMAAFAFLLADVPFTLSRCEVAGSTLLQQVQQSKPK